MANNYKRWLCEESLKALSSRAILIYFEFRSKPSLITVIAWTLTRPTNFNLLRQNIVFSYSERMTVSFSWLFHYFSFFFLFCYFTFLWIFTKIILLLIFIYFFYSWKIFLFFHVPGCSGMFRDVPCSWFYRRPGIVPLRFDGLWWAGTR